MKTSHITTSRNEIARAVDTMLAEFDTVHLGTQNVFEPQHPGETYGDNFAQHLLTQLEKQRGQ